MPRRPLSCPEWHSDARPTAPPNGRVSPTTLAALWPLHSNHSSSSAGRWSGATVLQLWDHRSSSAPSPGTEQSSKLLVFEDGRLNKSAPRVSDALHLWPQASTKPVQDNLSTFNLPPSWWAHHGPVRLLRRPGRCDGPGPIGQEDGVNEGIEAIRQASAGNRASAAPRPISQLGLPGDGGSKRWVLDRCNSPAVDGQRRRSGYQQGRCR